MSDTTSTADGVEEISAPDRLREIIEQIQQLEERKKEVSEEIKDVYAEAKSQGYDPKVLRRVIALLKLDKDARDEMDANIEVYMNALGAN